MKRNFLGAMIALAASAILFSCEEPAPEPKPVPLATPVVSVSEQTETSFVIAWEAVEHAVSYTYTINDGAEENTTNQSAEFTDLTEGTYTVKVKAIAPEGDEFLDSDWASINVTIESAEDPEPEQLSAPQLSIASQDETSFVIEWSEVANAVSYAYTFNGGAETATDALSAEFTDLTAGDYTVKVKAVGDGTAYVDSDWASINVTIESGDEPDPDTDIAGQYAANVDGVDVVYEIVNEGGEYRVFPLTYINGDEAYYTATLSGNALTVSLTGIDVNVEGMGLVSVIMCGYHTADDGETYLWPDENCVLEFGENSFTATNGIFLGFQSGGSWYNWTGSNQPAGTVFTKGDYTTGSRAASYGASVASSASQSSVAAR